MFAICALVTGLLAGTALQDGRISGRVIDDNTGAPVAGESVTLVPDAGILGAQRVFTDQAGRYAFEGVASGGYRIDALAPRRSDQLPAQRHVGIGPQQALENVDLHFRKGASIAGRVFDTVGHPIRAAIRVLAPLTDGCASSTHLLNTNDAGEFLADHLPAGEFYIVATSPAPAQPARARLVTTYYPGTPDRTAAQQVSVTAGATVTGVMFAVQSVPAFRVSGIVVDSNGKAVQDADVVLTGAAPTCDPLDTFVGRSRSGVDGRFTFEDVPAGTYRASSNAASPAGDAAPTNAADPPLRAGVSGGVVAGVMGGVGGLVVSRGDVGRIDPPLVVLVADADVSAIRVVVRLPTPR
jgi:Carboxypeptidase regulatory-like domain